MRKLIDYNQFVVCDVVNCKAGVAVRTDDEAPLGFSPLDSQPRCQPHVSKHFVVKTVVQARAMFFPFTIIQ